MIDDIYSRTPINGTAAIVTNQHGCTDEMTLEQLRENILDRTKQVESLLMSLPKGSKERKKLGLKKFNLCNEIAEINNKLKKRKVTESSRMDYVDCVFHVMREQIPAFQYRRIIGLADALLKELDKE